MPAPKGLTKQLPLRMTDDERRMLEQVQEVYGSEGVQLSLNDVARHLIRRAGIILACTPGEILLQFRQHCETCELCDFDREKAGCPEGLFFLRSYRRVLRVHRGTNEADGL